jgi:hypothetical protein
MPVSNCTASIVAISILALLFGSRCIADEALWKDGRRTAGALRAEPDGRLRFAKESGADLPLADIQDVRFPMARAHPTLIGAPLRVQLSNSQFVTGELLELSQKSIKLRTSWSAALQLPRSAVDGLTHLPGFITIFSEDFESDRERLALTGSPALDDKHCTSARRSLRLDAAGQSASYTLPARPIAGRVGVNFCPLNKPSGARWLVEADFGGKRPARIVLAGEESYAVESELAGETRPLPQGAGWHRLSLRFCPDYLLVGVDDRLLFESAKGPGKLRQVRIACAADGSDKSIQGAVLFDDLAIAKAVDKLRHESGDPNQDELWLVGGDQLFGSVPRGNRYTVEINGSFGKRSLPWSELRGLFPKSEAPEPRTSDGQHVRVWLTNGFPEADELEGVLRSLDDRKLVFRHVLLGDLSFDRSRLHRLRPLVLGQRIELDNARHHLGDASRPVPGLAPPRPEGPALRRPFRLDAIPATARLAVTVHHLKGPVDGIGPALQRGELRTEVFVNERRIDYLNRRVDRAVKETQRLEIALPTSALRIGENVVELRQTPEAATGRRESCVVSNLVIELPR